MQLQRLHNAKATSQCQLPVRRSSTLVQSLALSLTPVASNTMRNIKEIKAELSALRDEYDAKVRALEAEIVAVRDKRGYVPVTPAYEEWFEAGRSMEPGAR